MVTHFIQEMQDVTLVAASVHAWTQTTCLGKINSVLFASVTRVVVAVFKCVRIGGIPTIMGSCTVTCTGMDAVFNVAGEFRYLPRCKRELQERTHGKRQASEGDDLACVVAVRRRLRIDGCWIYRVRRLKHRLTMEIAEAYRNQFDGEKHRQCPVGHELERGKGKNRGGTEPDRVVDVRDASATAVR